MTNLKQFALNDAEIADVLGGAVSLATAPFQSGKQLQLEQYTPSPVSIDGQIVLVGEYSNKVYLVRADGKRIEIPLTLRIKKLFGLN